MLFSIKKNGKGNHETGVFSSLQVGKLVVSFMSVLHGSLCALHYHWVSNIPLIFLGLLFNLLYGQPKAFSNTISTSYPRRYPCIPLGVEKRGSCIVLLKDTSVTTRIRTHTPMTLNHSMTPYHVLD